MSVANRPPGTEAPVLSVVIVNWNARDHLATLIRTLPEAVASLSYEALVVDNASEDGSVDMLRSRSPHVRLLAQERNLGFGAGVQAAIPSARGEFVAVVNPDVQPDPGSLDQMVRFLQSRPQAGVVGPTHRAEDGACHGGAERLPGVLSALLDFPGLGRWRRRHGRLPPTGGPQRCGWVRGACLVLRRTALLDIGGFPRDTFLYGEEILLGERMRRRGHEVWFLPTVAITHAKGASVARRWTEEEVLLERRQARITVMRALLSRPRSMLWNLLTVFGLSLQAALNRGRRAALLPYGCLLRLHGAALLWDLGRGRSPSQEKRT